jgi:Ca2+-transporting ATPase
MLAIQDILSQRPADTAESGLTSALVQESRQQFGSNRLTPLPRQPLWQKFLEKFDEPIVKILLAAALLSTIVEQFATKPGTDAWVGWSTGGAALLAVAIALGVAYARHAQAWVPTILFAAALILLPIGAATGHPSYDGLAVMIAVILATGVAFVSEYQSDREFEVLNARKEELQVKTIRDGSFHAVSLEDIVVGDLVLLELGDEVPADGRLVSANELFVDQSLMTGESEPVRKVSSRPDDKTDGPEHAGCLYRGTQVVDGVGRMLVTDVGDATALGQIARQLSLGDSTAATAGGQRVQSKLTISKSLTPLQEKLAELARLISKIGYIAAAAIFLALLIRGIWLTQPAEIYWPVHGDDVVKVATTLLHNFMYMVIIIVVAVPEGLPMSVTVSLALAMRKMTRANSLVRQLVACETIGSATVICSDKTGTLTQNKMQVARVVWNRQSSDRGSTNWPRLSAETTHQATQPLDLLALNAAINSTAQLEEKAGQRLVVGNSTEGALLLWLHESGIDYRGVRLQFPPLYQLHFSSERKQMATVVTLNDRLVVLVKGAPEWVLDQCRFELMGDGTAREATEEFRQSVRALQQDAAHSAMRTLAFAHAVLPGDLPATEDALHARRETIEKDLVFVGMVAIRDPLRDDVQAALAECRRAGIEVKMITGDNVETARSIAREVGLLDVDHNVVLTSQEFNALGDDELKKQLPQLRVVARARPLDKLRLVKLLQEMGEVVAVTGDGTNDAPALKKADVGLAMGQAGTEVAKEASKIVLLDDAFCTIVHAVHWGRALYENIQRFLQFQLTINVSALTIAFLGPFLGVKPPFTILQLLWINVIMDTLAAIALCSEKPRPGLMDLPPKKRAESILTPPMLRTIAITAGFFVAVMLVLLLGLKSGWFRGDGPVSQEFPEFTDRQVSLFFSVYVLFQAWNEINCRSLVPEVSGWRGLFSNPTFLAIVTSIVALQVLIVTFGGSVFRVEPLSLVDWLAIAVATSSVLLFAEVMRRFRRTR